MSSYTRKGEIRKWRRGKRSILRSDIRRMLKHECISQSECDRALASLVASDDLLVAMDTGVVRCDANGRLTDGSTATLRAWLTGL